MDNANAIGWFDVYVDDMNMQLRSMRPFWVKNWRPFPIRLAKPK